MKNNYDKQRKYSLRKSKPHGLTLAVIGIMYFCGGTINVSADVVTNADNTTTISNSLASVTVDTDKYLENDEKTADQLFADGAYTTPETKTTGTEVVSETKTTDYNYVSTTGETIAPTVTTEKSQDITKDYTVGGKSGKEYTNETADIPVDTTANKPETITSGDKTYRYKSTEVVSEGTSATTTTTNFNDIAVKTDTQGYHNADGSVNYDNLSTGNTYLVEENADGTYGKFIKVDSPSGLTDAKVKELASQAGGTFNSASVTLNDNDNVIVYEKNTYAARAKTSSDVNHLYNWGSSTSEVASDAMHGGRKLLESLNGHFPNLEKRGDDFYYKGTKVYTGINLKYGDGYEFTPEYQALDDNAKLDSQGYLDILADLGKSDLSSDPVLKQALSDYVNVSGGHAWFIRAHYLAKELSSHLESIITSPSVSGKASDGRPTSINVVTRISESDTTTPLPSDSETISNIWRSLYSESLYNKLVDELVMFEKNYTIVTGYSGNDNLDDFRGKPSLENFMKLVTEPLDNLSSNTFSRPYGFSFPITSTAESANANQNGTVVLWVGKSTTGVTHEPALSYKPSAFVNVKTDNFTYHDEITPLRAYKVGAKNAVVKYVYEEVKKAPVIANYYKDGTTDKLADSDDQGKKEVDSSYTTTAKTIEPRVETVETDSKTITRTTNYVLKETPSNANGTVPEQGAVVNYYYVENVTETVTPKKAPVVANYYKDGTTDKLADSDDQGQKDIESNYTTVAKTIEPKVETIESPEKTITRTTTYELKEMPSNATGTVPVGGAVVNYYYVEKVTETSVNKQAPVIANYYKDGTTDKLADSDNQGMKDISSNYTTSAKSIEPKVETIDSPDKVVTRTTTYTLKETPSNANGTVPVGGAVVDYYYIENVTETVTPKQAPVVANYYKDGTTEKLADSDNQGMKNISSDYTTSAKSIEPKVETIDSPERTVTRTTTYELKEVPSNATGKVPVGGAVVDYYYVEKVTETSVSKQAPVVANYYKDGTTEKLADSDDQGQKDISSKYTTSAKSIEPKVETIDSPDKVVTRTTTYTLKETPANAEGTVPVGGEVVNYYYVEKVTETVTPKQAPVIANYYKDGTDEKLADSDNQGDKDISSKYTTTAKTIEPKVETIDSPDKVVTRTTTYTLKETPTNAEGTVPVGGAVVNYYYVEKVTETSVSKQAPVVANYYKDGTTDKLADSDNQGMKDISSKYTTSAKSIEPKVETIETDSKTVVRTTTYTLKEVPSNAEGTVPVDGAVVNYYYVEKVTETSVSKQAPVVANYYKDGTTDKLADSDNQGMKDIDSSYTTSAKSIEPKVETIDSPEKVTTRTTTYELKEVPSNAEGTVPVGGVVVNYYYVEKVTETSVSKQAPVVANYYKDGTTDKLADSDNQGMKDINSSYTTSAKSIEPKVETVEKDGETITRTTTYELKEVPSNANGNVPVNGAVVNYYYVEKVTETKVPKSEEPKVPETPKPEEPKVPETPKPEEPKVPETPKPEEPKVPETPKREEPKVPSTPKVPETPKREEPKVPETPKREEPKVPSTPKVPETPKREEPKVPSTPKVPETPKREEPKSETPKVSETPKREESKGNTPVSASTEQQHTMSRVVDRHELPNTGESSSKSVGILGLVTLGLGLVGFRKRKTEE